MSRAIVFNKTAARRMFNSIKNKMNAIRSAGFPKETAETSLPGFGLGITSPISGDFPLPIDFMMSADLPVPLSLVEYSLVKAGLTAPKNLLSIDDLIKKVSRPVQTFTQQVVHLEEPQASIVLATKYSEDIMASASQDNVPTVNVDKQNDSESDQNVIANSLIAAMKENNLETKAPEVLSPSITRITLDEVLVKRNIRIPEFVMVRR